MKNKRFDTETQFKEWNEDMAHRYDPEAYHERSFIVIRWMERRRVNIILSHINASPNRRVLEVGCGAGNVLQQVKSDYRVGVDLSDFLLRKARTRLGKAVPLSMANAERIPFAAEVFDGLICTEVLEHVQDPSGVLSEMARVAKPDAVILVSIPNEKMIDFIKSLALRLKLKRLFQSRKDDYAIPEKMTDEWHLHHFDVRLLEGFLPPTLAIESVQAVPFGFLPLRYVAKIKRTSAATI